MAGAVIGRHERLQELEKIIREGMEKFIAVGLALKEIRDKGLYKEDSFDTWDAYLQLRVGQDFGLERAHAHLLVAVAQVRLKVGNVSSDVSDENHWTIRELRELGRLAPKMDKHDQRYDYDRLDARDVKRVIKKVEAHCQEEGIKRTSAVIRKFVDEDLGIDRSAQAAETRRKEEEARQQRVLDYTQPVMDQYLVDMSYKAEEQLKKLETVPDESWRLFMKEDAHLVCGLSETFRKLADLFQGIEERCGKESKPKPKKI